MQILKRYYEELDGLMQVPGAAPREMNRRAVVQSLANVGPVMVTAG